MTLFADSGSFDPTDRSFGDPVDIKPTMGAAEAFPVECLPDRLRDAIEAIVDVVQVPLPIAAQSVLGACSLVTQTCVNIKMPTREVVPSALFLLTIAQSGERKSSCDRLALRAVYDFEKDLRAGYESKLQHFNIDKAAYDAAVSAAKRGKKNRAQIQEDIEGCGRPPVPPAVPAVLVDDATMEGIARLLDEAYPSIGIFSDEGAKMLGGWSLQPEREAATGAFLSQLWDGKPIKRVRAGDVTKYLPGRRSSLHLMVQPGVASKLFGNKALRDQGMMSRMLVAHPASLRGQRMWSEPKPQSWAALDKYNERISNLLREAFTRMDPESRELTFTEVELQAEAREMWIGFSDQLEQQQGPDGPLAEIADLASKMGQHVLRIAACVSYFQAGNSFLREGISLGGVQAGIEIGKYYLAEAVRLFNAGSVDEDSENAAAIIDFVRKEGLERVGRRWLSQNCPKHCRSAETFKRAVGLLVEHDHLFSIDKGFGAFRVRGKELNERRGFVVVYPEGGK